MNITDIQFIDIKAVPQYDVYEVLPAQMKKSWAREGRRFVNQHAGETLESAYRFAGLCPEFGKIVCITVGFVYYPNNSVTPHVRTLNFSGCDERELLAPFSYWLRCNTNAWCCYDAQGFNFHYIQQRFKALGLELPAALDDRKKNREQVNPLLNVGRIWNQGRSAGKLNYKAPNLVMIEKELARSEGADYKVSIGQTYWKFDYANVAKSSELDLCNLVRLYCGMMYADKKLVFANQLDEAYAS